MSLRGDVTNSDDSSQESLIDLVDEEGRSSNNLEARNSTDDHDGDSWVPGHGEGDAYVKEIVDLSGLHLLQPTRIQTALREFGEFGLFCLFFPVEEVIRIRNMTNTSRHLKREVSLTDIQAYTGLEIGISIIGLGRIADYWSNEPFLRQPDFPQTTSPDRSQNIRASLKLNYDGGIIESEKQKDSLWRIRAAFIRFQKRIESLSVPKYGSTLDENSVRTKARKRAKSYIPNKPDKFAVRFYCIVDWRTVYLHTVFDNGGGNQTEKKDVERYLEVFSPMRTPVHRVFTLGSPNVGARPLWTTIVAQQTQRAQSPNGRRILFTDNYYTSNSLARHIEMMTDREVTIIGTMRMNYVDRASKKNVQEAAAKLKNEERNKWILVRAKHKQDFPSNLGMGRSSTRARGRGRPRTSNSRAASDAGAVSDNDELWEITQNAGYIIWNDSKVVVFYTNDLCETPSRDVRTGDDEEGRRCVRGLIGVRRWTREDMLHRRLVQVANSIEAYNKFMNGVDKMDQLRSTTPTRRKEQRLQMSLFTWLLDLCLNNAFVLRTELCNRDESIPRMGYQTMKRKVMASFVQPALMQRVITANGQRPNMSKRLASEALAITDMATQASASDRSNGRVFPVEMSRAGITPSRIQGFSGDARETMENVVQSSNTRGTIFPRAVSGTARVVAGPAARNGEDTDLDGADGRIELGLDTDCADDGMARGTVRRGSQNGVGRSACQLGANLSRAEGETSRVEVETNAINRRGENALGAGTNVSRADGGISGIGDATRNCTANDADEAQMNVSPASDVALEIFAGRLSRTGGAQVNLARAYGRAMPLRWKAGMALRRFCTHMIPFRALCLKQRKKSTD